mgnify:FL=1|jgi:hypothetical protein
MELIIQNDGLYQLVVVTKEMTEHILLLAEVDCMDLCEILRLKLTTYADSLNLHVMNDGSGNFYGCICK